jgi:hypothetical protein
MKFISKFLSVAALLLMGLAHALTPEPGLWVNPNAAGTGYNIEVQDNILAITIYSTDRTGAPVYYLAAGTMVGDNKFTGPMLRFSNGQCFNCTYQAPQVIQDGTISLTFTTSGTALVSVNSGTSYLISRYAFGINAASPYVLFGEWGHVQGTQSYPIYFAERIQLGATYVYSGLTYAVGSRSGSTGNLALGYLDADGYFYQLLDSSTSYYQFSKFRLSGLNTIEGSLWTYLKTGVPSGTGMPFYANRIRSATAVQTGVGPGINTKSAVDQAAADAHFEQQNMLRANAQNLVPGAKAAETDPGVVSIANMLQQALRNPAP